MRALERSGSSLEHFLKAIRRTQRKLNLEREKHKLVHSEIIQRSKVIDAVNNKDDITDKHPKGIAINFSKHQKATGFI